MSAVAKVLRWMGIRDEVQGREREAEERDTFWEEVEAAGIRERSMLDGQGHDAVPEAEWMNEDECRDVFGPEEYERVVIDTTVRV